MFRDGDFLPGYTPAESILANRLLAGAPILIFQEFHNLVMHIS